MKKSTKNRSKMFYAVRAGKRSTTNVMLAREVAADTGLPAIQYIGERFREAYEKLYPDLADAVSK